MLELGTYYMWPVEPANPGTAKLVAKFTCEKFTPGDEETCHEAKGVIEVKLMACRDMGRWLVGDGDYTYDEVPVPITMLWTANVGLQLPWGCCDDWVIFDAFHNPLGLSERDAHDLIQTTGICDHLAALISKEEKAHA